MIAFFEDLNFLFQSNVSAVMILFAMSIYLLGLQNRGLLILMAEEPATGYQLVKIWIGWGLVQGLRLFTPVVATWVAARFGLFLQILVMSNCLRARHGCETAEWLANLVPLFVTGSLVTVVLHKERKFIATMFFKVMNMCSNE